MNKVYLSHADTYLFLKSLSKNSLVVLEATTNSMWPLIKVGDQLTLKKVDISTISKYDIIAFYSKDINKNIVHRVIKKNCLYKNISFLTKGDNSKSVDKNAVDKNNFIGIIINIQNKNIYLNRYLHSLPRYRFLILNSGLKEILCWLFFIFILYITFLMM